jgi:DNA-binding GntR family transcriptional regulator
MSKNNTYAAIKQQILIGHYKPGDLLNERALMDEYGIGKTPLREIFLHLERDGLIRRYARIGTIVSPIDTRMVYDVAEIRHYLEDIVARLAVKRISEKMLEEMSAGLKRMEDAIKEENHDYFAQEEAGLHNMLYTATGNSALKAFIEKQYELFTRIWFSVSRTPMDLTVQLNHWKAIWQALRDRDEEQAVASNTKHFEDYFEHLKSMR